MALWGLKTDDYAYLDEFYPTRRLKEACKDRGLELRFLFPRDLPEFLEKERLDSPPDSGPDRTLFLIRGAVAPETVRLIEGYGYTCVNSAESLALAADKLETARFLARNGWPTPETEELFMNVDSPQDIPRIGDQADRPLSTLSFPFISKPRTGSRGQGVRLIASQEDLAEALGEAAPDGGFIAQEYISSSRGRDLRVFFAGDRVLAVAERRSADGGFISNVSTGGILRQHSLADGALEPWLETTLDIARKARLWYGSVDYLFLDEMGDGAGSNRTSEPGGNPVETIRLTVCEVNGSPGFEALERGLGADIAGPLVDALIASFFPEQLL